MTLSNLTICYEGIQRIYRNAVVTVLRSTLKAEFPGDYAEKLRKPFAQEWKQMEENCYRSRVSGQLASGVVDEFDVLSANHFFNLFDLYHHLLFPTPANADKVEKRADKKRVLEWTRTVKDLRDPASHPAEEDFTYEDSFVLLDCARRVLLQLKLNDKATEVKALMARLSGHTHVIGEPLEGTLPPSETIVSEFVGRQDELKALWDWLLNPTTRRWALSGAGGKGKSAIAYKFALDVREKAPNPLQAILWLSAKKKRFAEGHIVPVATPDFENLDSALNQILFQYGWIEEISKSPESKRHRALQLFNEFPSLVIVDDIDTISSSDEDVVEFFSFAVPQTKSKVLLTSRRVIWGMANTTTQVSGFADSDVGRFITSRCQLFGIDRAIFDTRLVKEMVSVTEGSPLYIEDLIRFASAIPPAEAIKTWKEKGGQNAREYALGRELDLLTSEARTVLIAACFYQNAVSFEELRAVTGYSQTALFDSLSQLQGLFLVPKAKLIEGEARFEINVNVRSLIREVEGRSEKYRSVEAAFKSVSGALPKVGKGEIGGLIRQAVLLVKTGEEEQAANLLIRALEIHPNDPDLIGVLGFVYRRMQPARITDARDCFVRSDQLNNKSEEMYKHWARMELELREWTKAAEAAERGLRKRPSKQLAYLAGLARSRLGQDMRVRVQNVSANSELKKSLDHFDIALSIASRGDEGSDLDAATYRGVVISASALGERERIRVAFTQWYRDFPDDQNAASEWDRISGRFNLTFEDIGVGPKRTQNLGRR